MSVSAAQPLLLAAALGIGGTASEEVAELPSASINLPSGWVVEKNGKGSVIASPDGPRTSSYLAFVQSCTATDQRDCDPTCDPESIRKNFFHYRRDATLVERDGEFLRVEVEDSQRVEQGWMSYSFRRILCKPGRLIAVSAMSKNSAQQSRDVVDAIARTLRWR